MRSPIGVGLMPALAAGSLAFALSACGAPAAVPIPLRPTASAAADSLGDHYAALEWLADSVVAAQSPDDAAPSELAQVTARNLAGRIEALSGDYGTLSVAMTAADYERGVSLWMRLAMAQAALELIHEDAYRLANDPTTGPSDLRDLADRLSGALELGRVSGRMASREFGPPEGRQRPVTSAPCGDCRPIASQS
ncbi:MAG TPA: hypothetical protein VFN08_16805 [Gemmatimonadales bacterium]|nr:hypothetical protein [Gemmatimonadales bacterium]